MKKRKAPRKRTNANVPAKGIVSQAKGKYPRRFRDIKKVRYVVDYSNARRRNGVFKSVPIN